MDVTLVQVHVLVKLADEPSAGEVAVPTVRETAVTTEPSPTPYVHAPTARPVEPEDAPTYAHAPISATSPVRPPRAEPASLT